MGRLYIAQKVVFIFLRFGGSKPPPYDCKAHSFFILKNLWLQTLFFGWVQYCSNMEYLSRLKLKCDSDSLIAGSDLHQIEFDFVLQYGAYSVYLTLVRTPNIKSFREGL